MSEPTDTPRVPPEVVGQDRPPQVQNKSGVGGFLRANLLTWIVVIAVFVIFIAAIVFAGVLN